MNWPFSIRNILYPEEKYIWAQVRIIHETDKAILVDTGGRSWIPKSRILAPGLIAPWHKWHLCLSDGKVRYFRGFQRCIAKDNGMKLPNFRYSKICSSRLGS